MAYLHPMTFVFILVIAFCLGWLGGLAFGFRAGVRACSAQLKDVSDELNRTADQLAKVRR